MLKKKRRRTRTFSMVASALMVFSLVAPSMTYAESAAKNNKIHESAKNTQQVAEAKVSDRLHKQFSDQKQVTYLVKFKEKTDTKQVAQDARKKAQSNNLSATKAEFTQRSAVISALKATAQQSQQNVKAYLQKELEKGSAKEVHSYHIVNGMAVTSTKEVAEKIASFEEVEKLLPNETRQLLTPVDTKVKNNPESELTNVEWNVERVGAPEVWEDGIDGTGSVVANIDTGVQWDHPALQNNYRGYDADTGEASHDYNWFDATAGESEPYDDQGHGTHVMGTMVGNEPDGSNQVGVAPGAKFIAVKAFTAAGGTDADLLEAAEWIMAPTDSEGNARADLAPDVVNNSWGGGPGLDEWYRDVVTNWRAAGIFPTFSAGNTSLTNPGGPGSVATPANYPESFAVGATDSSDNLAGFSLRGPSPYDEIKPEISAPGVNIRSSVPGDGYDGTYSGTSMASPAVSGAVALLRQVDSSITVDELEEVLINSAIPMTDDEYSESPNNGYGHGLLNAYDAVALLDNGLGTIKGTVTKHGEDNVAPTIEHTAPEETYEGMDLPLNIHVEDDISIASVLLEYQNANGEWVSVEAGRTSGDYKSADYTAAIPGDQINGDSLTYKWTVEDFGENTTESDTYTVDVLPGISLGYSEDFEGTQPAGWSVFGENSSWEWGTPESGPGNAASGENVYATNLAGDYDSDMNATLMMPPIDLPEGEAYLQFNQWHDLEQYSSGTAYDFGHVFISTDQEEWTQILQVTGTTSDWEEAEVDLSEYSGQRVYIGFNVTTDGSVTREGWYIDDVALSDTSNGNQASLHKKKGNNGKTKGKNKGRKNGNAFGFMNGLGVMKSSPSAGLKEKVNPADIQPNLPKEDPPAQEDYVNPNLLPMQAQVSVLESGRSVTTDPATGEYSISHAAGEFTLKAESYGYESQEQSVTLEADSEAVADFTLEEVDQFTATGKVTDQATGEPVEGATVLLAEDANVAPVATDENGEFSITGYEGSYTLKIMAPDYYSKDVSIDLTEDVQVNAELEPLYTYPGGEIGYDDGTAENARAFYDAGNAWAVKMSLPEGKDQGVVTDGVFRFWNEEWPQPGGTEFAVEIWDANGEEGLPGEKIAGPIEAEALRNGEWTVVDLREHNIFVDGDFYMVYVQTHPNPDTPGLATDESSEHAGRSFQRVAGEWSPSPTSEGNYMIRARVSYEVEDPQITSPEAGLITSDEEVTVTGTASPTTEVELTNNGEAAGTIEVGESGEFDIPVELTEGENVLKAVSKLDGAVTGESEEVSVTLDTTSPELTIDSPEDESKSNRETVTVEGTVNDANLDWVKVNGSEANISDDGTYSKRVLLDNGENEIEVVAQDLAGNQTTETITLDVDFTAPEISNLLPEEDHELKAGESVRIEFDSETDLDATFVIHMPLTNARNQVSNATELPMMEMSDGHYVGYWTATSNLKAEGAVIEVKAVDDHGNETRKKADGKLYIN
ncbi:bacillopeptidase F [Salinibacillus aidingensis]|uniref:Bacillopeptidase F n=1 Tax=Salinibacillus aidingensis TaxID=237684 RepID=A0ABP3L6E0_9BACI